jgi:hypothetical protein
MPILTAEEHASRKRAKGQQQITVLYAAVLSGFIFDPEAGGDMFLRNISGFSPICEFLCSKI